MKKRFGKFMSILLTMVMLAGLMPATAMAEEPIMITSANAEITAPVGGEHPDDTPVASGEGYTVQFRYWYLNEGPGYPHLDAEEDVFETGKSYCLRVTFELEEGYAFADDCKFTINGEETYRFGVDWSMAEGEFVAAAPVDPYVITSANAEITAPVGGEHPDDTPVASGEGYTVRFVSWYLNEGPGYPHLDAEEDVFETGKSYCLRVTFELEEGYSFADDCKFTINGEETYRFGVEWSMAEREFVAAAGDEVIANRFSKIELTVTPPEIGQDLVEKAGVAADAPYKVEDQDVDWYESDNSTDLGEYVRSAYHPAAAGKYYTVEFEVAVQDGYEVADDAEVFINGNKVEYTYDPAHNTLTCQLKFDKLGYTVSFDGNGGTGTMADVTRVSGEYTLPECGFTAPDGMEFNGWQVNERASRKLPGAKIEVSSDVKLTAAWADEDAVYTVTLRDQFTDAIVEIENVSGEYTLPACPFDVPEGYYFDCWDADTDGDGKREEYQPGDKVRITADTLFAAISEEIPAIGHISNVTFAADAAADYKYGIKAGDITVSVPDEQEHISLADGGYGTAYWISDGETVAADAKLSTTKNYSLYVVFHKDEGYSLDPDGIKLKNTVFGGDLTADARYDEELGALVVRFDLPSVPGTDISADHVAFTMQGYEIDKKVMDAAISIDTENMAFVGSGYGSGADQAYMIYKDSVDYDHGILDGYITFAKHTYYYLEIDFTTADGYSLPDSFREDGSLIKDKFRLNGVEDAEVDSVSKTSDGYRVRFKLPQLGASVVEKIAMTMHGYEAGKEGEDVSFTFPACVNDVEDYDYYDDYWFYGAKYAEGFGATDVIYPVFEKGNSYQFMMRLYLMDGYDITEVEKEDITITTPFGTSTARDFGLHETGYFYWADFELPVIGDAVVPETYTVTVENDGHGTASASPAKAKAGETVTLTATPNSGYEFKEWKVESVPEGTDLTIDENSKFTMPAGNVVVKAIFKEKAVTPVPETYTVTVENDGHGTASASPAAAAEGETVELTATPESGYEFEKWEVVSAPDGTIVNIENGKFTMPAGAVTVKATFKAKAGTPEPVKYKATVENGSGDGEYAAGAEVTITADSRSGYRFVKWTSDDVTVRNDKDATTAFIMPDKDVTVTAVYEKVSSGSSGGGGSTKYKVTVEDTDNGTVESNRTRASKGTTVTITVDPEAGYEVDDIVVETKAGKEVEVTDKGDGKFTFKMPAANVTVSVDFAKATESDDTQAEEEYILLTIDSVIAWVFDEYVTNDVPPVIRNERTMLPARFVAEALGGVVKWDEEAQKVTIVNDEDTIEIFIGEPFATVDGTPVELDCAAYIENGRTYLPLRFIAENLGAEVVWDAVQRTVTITP